MDLLETFYERLCSITKKKNELTLKQLKKCYQYYMDTIEIGEVFVEKYKDKLYIQPATSLIFKKIDKHPMFPRDIYVCVGIEKDNETATDDDETATDDKNVKNLTLTEILICQNNKWFFDVNSCEKSASEIPEDFYSIKL